MLSPDGDDPIFIGIKRLVAKGLNNDKQKSGPIEYPCQVVNRFQCPYVSPNIAEDDAESTNSDINVNNLLRLHKMAFIVEIALARARKEDSKVQIRDKQDLLLVLTDRETFTKILQQAADTFKSTEYLRETSSGQDFDSIVDYFMGIKDKICLEELRFY